MDTRFTLALAAALLTGCFDSDSPAELETICDEDGTCWARAADWDAWAEAFPSVILDSGILTDPHEVGAGTCWGLLGSDASVCALDIDGATLIARPVAELDMVESQCADPGPWEPAEALGWCWGAVGPLAVRLR